MLSYIEYRKPAIAHASFSVLALVDQIQGRLLADLGITDVEALNAFRLAPLRSRRDMALLGFLHRMRLGRGPPHFQKFFAEKSLHHYWGHSGPPQDDLLVPLSGTPLPQFAQRSAFGMSRVYNLLPQSTKALKTVKSFQADLQRILRERAAAGCHDWADTFSTSLNFTHHPLVR